MGKNYEVIFQAFQGLQPNYTLVFAGRVTHSYGQANNPRQLAQKYGLQQNTIIIDRYITDEEARYYFYAADVLILSHRKNFKAASGVLSDTARFGLPVIAANVGEVGRLVIHYGLGLTFVAEDPQSLREALLSFFNLRGDNRREIEKNFARFALDHSWQELARRHVRLYQTLLEQG